MRKDIERQTLRDHSARCTSQQTFFPDSCGVAARVDSGTRHSYHGISTRRRYPPPIRAVRISGDCRDPPVDFLFWPRAKDESRLREFWARSWDDGNLRASDENSSEVFPPSSRPGCCSSRIRTRRRAKPLPSPAASRASNYGARYVLSYVSVNMCMLESQRPSDEVSRHYPNGKLQRSCLILPR